MGSHFGEITQNLNKHPEPLITLKPDKTPVTELDLALSHTVETLSQKHFPDCCFYSEEKFQEWTFPLLALDPLDGTREYIDGRPEWSVSVGLFENENFVGEGWVANPVTKEIFSSTTVKKWDKKEYLRGEVSRTEFSQGLYRYHTSEKISLTAVGSIAYKLGRLSHGKMDFVVSLKPKNIWDIAGGSLLCKEAGLEFYSQGKKVTKVLKSYEPPLIWCHPSLFSELSQVFSS
ncbi:MAG: inositol monophosphatase family protein [Bdellovibrionota bacterium]